MTRVITWFSTFLELPRERFEEGLRFWSAVARWQVSPRRGDQHEFATLLPTVGHPHLAAQAVDGPPGCHLDVHVADVAAGVGAALALGAEAQAEPSGYTVLRPPGGFVFCVVPHGEAEFRTAFTGSTRGRGRPDEFEDLRRPAWSPLRFLLQRLEDEPPRTTAHLDPAADDRPAEVRRHESLGAAVAYVGRGWTTMTDPVGSTYCITDRVPAYDLP